MNDVAREKRKPDNNPLEQGPTGRQKTNPSTTVNPPFDSAQSEDLRHFCRPFSASRIGCMLLHRNSVMEYNEGQDIYNPFYTLHVNVRKCIDNTRLLSHSPNKKDPMNKDNMLIRLCQQESSLPTNSPLQNQFVYAVTSFVHDQPGGTDFNKFYLSSEDKDTTERQLHAVPVTIELISSALKWLKGEETTSTINNVTEGLNQYIKCLTDLHLPNGNVEDLSQFIQDRVWIAPVWGNGSDEFFLMIEKVKCPLQRWMYMRRFVTFNMAWQTKVVWVPVDSLHRSAVSDSVFNGIAPSGADDELKMMAKSFCLGLTPESEQDCLSKDSDIIVKCYSPSTIDQKFCLSMENISASQQKDIARQADHTVIHTLQTIVDNMNLGVGYLLDGVGKIYKRKRTEGSTYQISEDEFRLMLTTDFPDLTEGDIRIIIDDAPTELENPKKKSRSKELSNAILAEIYINTWIRVFSQQLHSYLIKFHELYQDIADIDAELNFKLVTTMSCVDFQQMFKARKSTSYRLSPMTYTKETGPIMQALFMPTQKHCDVLQDDIYKTAGKPHRLFEFVWILLYTQLSKASEEAIKAFLNPPTGSMTHLQQFDNKDLQSKARRMIRCLHLTIHYSSRASINIWKNVFFNRNKEATMAPSLPLIMRGQSKYFFLLISAVYHSCHFFSTMGHSPQSKQCFSSLMNELASVMAIDLTSYIDMDKSKEPEEYFKLLEEKLIKQVTGQDCTTMRSNLLHSFEDEITKNTMNFIIKIRLSEMEIEDAKLDNDLVQTRKTLLPILTNLVKGDLQMDTKSTDSSVELLEDGIDYLVELSKDGNESMTMEPKELGPESIIQVLGDTGDNPYDFALRHRIGDGVSDTFNWNNYLHLWKKIRLKERRENIAAGQTGKLAGGGVTRESDMQDGNVIEGNKEVCQDNNTEGSVAGGNTLQGTCDNNIAMSNEASEGGDEDGENSKQSSNNSKKKGTDSHEVAEDFDGKEETPDGKKKTAKESEGKEETSDGKKKTAKELTFSLTKVREAGNEVFDLVQLAACDLIKSTDFESLEVEDQEEKLYLKMKAEGLEETILRYLSGAYVKERLSLIKRQDNQAKKLKKQLGIGLKKQKISLNNEFVLDEAVCNDDNGVSDDEGESVNTGEGTNSFIDDGSVENNDRSDHQGVDNEREQAIEEVDEEGVGEEVDEEGFHGDETICGDGDQRIIHEASKESESRATNLQLSIRDKKSMPPARKSGDCSSSSDEETDISDEEKGKEGHQVDVNASVMNEDAGGANTIKVAGNESLDQNCSVGKRNEDCDGPNDSEDSGNVSLDQNRSAGSEQEAQLPQYIRELNLTPDPDKTVEERLVELLHNSVNP
jgi:hypothetical protein